MLHRPPAYVHHIGNATCRVELPIPLIARTHSRTAVEYDNSQSNQKPRANSQVKRSPAHVAFLSAHSSKPSKRPRMNMLCVPSNRSLPVAADRADTRMTAVERPL